MKIFTQSTFYSVDLIIKKYKKATTNVWQQKTSRGHYVNWAVTKLLYGNEIPFQMSDIILVSAAINNKKTECKGAGVIQCLSIYLY